MILKVAVGKLDSFEFYIIPPCEGSDLSHVRVLYKEERRNCLQDCLKQERLGELLLPLFGQGCCLTLMCFVPFSVVCMAFVSYGFCVIIFVLQLSDCCLFLGQAAC